MRCLSRLTTVAIIAVCASIVPAQDKKPTAPDDGFKPLFNGKNLDGWVNVNCHPNTFFVKGDEIITTGNPTGFLRTDRQYENFIMEFDWMHVEKEKMANSGLFVWGDPLPAVGTPYTRGIEVQVLINFAPKDGWATSHGDIFSIHGARCVPDRVHPVNPKMERCLPSENRVKGGGEWNHYKVTANDGAIKLEVNGKEVSGVSKCTPRKGYLALESEGSECHFKNIKIKELPSTNPKPEECAKVWEGHKSLFTGIDLAGWKTEKDSWKAGGGILRAAGKAELVSEKKYVWGVLTFDWKMPTTTAADVTAWVGAAKFSISPSGEVTISVGDDVVVEKVKVKPIKPGAWNRATFVFTPNALTTMVNGGEANPALGGPDKASPAGPIRFKPAAGLEIMNVFFNEVKEKK